MSARRLFVPTAALVFAMLSSCGAPTPADVPEQGAAELKALFERMQTAIRERDVDTASAITGGLLPDEAQLRRALRDDIGEPFDKILALHQRLTPPSKKQLAGLFATDPERTEVLVHRATTEQIIAYEKGTPAFEEFPGGARRIAPDVLRAGLAFYEVELLEPGKDAGMKYHLFYFANGRWSMLGPIWRALR